MSINILYTAHATAVGGRNGRTRSDDGLVDVQLSVPKAMGGPGKPGATTPEDLTGGGFGLKVDLIATIGGLSQADAEKVVAAGHTVCPYSNAVKGNVDVTVTVKTT